MATQAQIDEYCAVNAEFWRRWKERGVGELTELAVTFRFYSARRINAEELVRALKAAGFTVEQRRRWTFIFRGHEICATATGRWTLGLLQERSREFLEVADKLKVVYEGFGAEMP